MSNTKYLTLIALAAGTAAVLAVACCSLWAPDAPRGVRTAVTLVAVFLATRIVRRRRDAAVRRAAQPIDPVR